METENPWITNWTRIVDEELYLVCPIIQKADGTYCLDTPKGIYWGWSVKRFLKKPGYAALRVPEFKHSESAEVLVDESTSTQ